MTEPNSNWNQIVGDWEIDPAGTVTLHEKEGGGGTAGAKIICVVPVPESSGGSMYVRTQVYNFVADDVFRVYPCCPDINTVSTVYGQFTYLGSLRWKVEVVGAPVATVTYMTHSPTGDGSVALWVCADTRSQMVKASIIGIVETDEELAWAEGCDIGDGRYSGLGHNNETTGAYFDAYEVGELVKGNKKVCWPCWCWCLGHAVKKTLVLTFFNATGRAHCLTGEDIDLYFEYRDGTPVWHGEKTITHEGASQTIGFSLSCSTEDSDLKDWPGKNFTIVFEPSACCNATVPNCSTYVPKDYSTCEDFNLVFGPFYLAYTDGTCFLCYTPFSPAACMDGVGTGTEDANCNGEFWFAVTEA